MPATAACASPRSAVCRLCQPERTLLYRTVQTHLATWLTLRDDGFGGGAPAVTKREFRRYLDCGILAHGFAGARGTECGHDLLVAYSGKCRGVCPSCTTRCMVETAADLAAHVIPRLPVPPGVRSFIRPPRLIRQRLERFRCPCADDSFGRPNGYVGVLAPNLPLRVAVTSLAQPAGEGTPPVAANSTGHTGPIAPLAAPTDEPPHHKVARYAWALLRARIYEVLPLGCPHWAARCGSSPSSPRRW
ncbi:MAG: hypothetical protein AW10_01419 [Candidatus Accumulibacter appositus]|uniref:Transposase zinc-binding domain-containing protein n=1 Tax=Candidatus Accumulibacter appositus TaxID=1454003 RepID=A0A011P0D6_9PROT|nr:transposase zinc-binding domain-containing protein [Accumulibacter sp.]EXI81076.1 MAG: hypothetical protein AW10_01419 [Candidatus Accumulibacter appositus]HRF05694.1 transposase zinc-binding domain-containing protein [Accumulibacter sp.]